MSKQMMIDYHKEDGEGFERKQVDDMEFSVRNGMIYFISEGVKYKLPLDRCSQVYLT